MKLSYAFPLLFTTALAIAADKGDSSSEAIKRLDDAHQVFTEAIKPSDKGIPRDLLEKAHCVAIVPGLKQGALIVGAKYGKGVLFCRQATSGWRGPATVRIEGGSIGLQAGAGEVDVLMLVMNRKGADRILKNEFKLGGEATAMAGPIGRSVQAETDAYMRAEILGWSRSRGVFAGFALGGSTLREDLDDNERLYGKRLTNEEILRAGAPSVAPPAAARPLLTSLNSISRKETK